MRLGPHRIEDSLTPEEEIAQVTHDQDRRRLSLVLTAIREHPDSYSVKESREMQSLAEDIGCEELLNERQRQALNILYVRL